MVDLLGYHADWETAVEILEGLFEPPDNMDGPTLLLFEEMGRIWKKMEAGEVDIVVTADDFQHYWKRAKEKTSSSYSKLHFGHYKAAAYDNNLAALHCVKLNEMARRGLPLKR